MGVLNAEAPSAQDETLSAAALTVIQKKQENIDTVLADTKARYHPITGSDTILFYGNVFNFGYLIFEGVKCAAPATKTISGVMIASMVFGVVGGAINIAVGLVCLKEALQAVANKDYAKAARLFCDFFFCTAIGMLMIVVSLAPSSALGTFFVANPWVLPLLWLIITIPLFIEITYGTQKIWRATDIASTLKLDPLKTLLEAETVDWNQVKAHLQNTILDIDQIQDAFQKHKLHSLSDRMEVLQAEMGPVSAVATMRLFHAILNRKKEDAIKTIEELQGHVSFWNKALHVRLLQQLFFFASFAVSMGALHMHRGIGTIEATQNFALAAANGIPLYMDLFWPFARNTTLVVPKVDMEKTSPQSAAS